MNFRPILTVLFAGISALMTVTAQVITVTPVYPTDIDSCTIVFDATQGNAELKDVAPPLYAHTGVITDQSTSPSDWKYVVAEWTTNLPKAQLTPLGNNKYQLKLNPSIRSYYGVPAGETIEKLAFVFRNSNGSKVGREANGGDIFYDVYPAVTSVNITLPATRSLLKRAGDSIEVAATSPLADSLFLFVNNSLRMKVAGTTISDKFPADNFGQNWTEWWIRVTAKNDTAMVSDSIAYRVISEPVVAELPAGATDGINYTGDGSAVLVLYAPGKEFCFATGDFNDWTYDSLHYMKSTPDGSRFWLELTGLTPRQEYIFQYLVDGVIRIGDPYADKVSDPNDQYISPDTYPNLKPYPAGKASGVATYLQTAQESYVWNTTPFTPPQITDLVIYELLIRDFTQAHDYPSLIDTLDYLKNLGINAIELMPVMEFEGNISWGYNPNYSFAVDKYYGTKNGLKQFVEAAHARGMAVILDIVCNHHFGSSPLVQLYWDGGNQRPAADNPWFNPIPKHPFNVGFDFNHESTDTRAYMERLIRYWLTEFHVDGYRFDLSKGFTQKDSYPNNVSLWGQYDADRIDILKNYTEVIHSVNPQAYAIMEHFADNSEEKVLSASGMLLWGNMNGAYINAAGGWNTSSSSSLSWGSYKSRSWTEPNLVTYAESHDEERVMYRNIKGGNSNQPPYNIKDTTTGLKRIELNANFFFTIPGPKMIWQFGETGYDYSINYPSGTSASRLDPKPPRWDYLGQWRRRYTRNVFAALASLKTGQPVFRTTDFTLDVTGAIKRIWLKDTTMDVTVLGNFDVIAKEITPDFTKTGVWYEFWSGDSLTVTDVTSTLPFEPGEYRLYTTVRLPKPVFTGIGEETPGILETRDVLVYPNPASGMINVATRLYSPSDVVVSLFDMYGNRVYIHRFSKCSPGEQVFTIDVSTLAKGLYLVMIDAGKWQESGKIVVK